MKSESSHINLSLVSEFMKLYEKEQESKKNVKKADKVNKSTQSDIIKPKKKKKNKVKENETLESVNTDEPSKKLQGSSKKASLSKKKTICNMGDLEVQKMNLEMTDDVETLLDVSNVQGSSDKTKKRNKTAMNIQEDTEEVARKKVKSSNVSNENLAQGEEKVSHRQRQWLKKAQPKKNQNSNVKLIKENAVNKRKGAESPLDTLASDEPAIDVSSKAKKAKKFKPQNVSVVDAPLEENITVDQSSEKENTAKKSKKKKRNAKSLQDNNVEAKMDGEPAVKHARIQEVKPDAIAKDLEDLNIGDNAHTLTNLLDEMTVVDKNKRKKDRQKLNKTKNKKTNNLKPKKEKPGAPSTSVEQEEKVKWAKRKWNKDKKGDMKQHLQPSVLVENLPLKIMFAYKKLLLEFFGKFGTVTSVGVAEVYPTEETKPVFTTTVYFKEEKDAERALVEDNTLLEGNRIRVRRMLPAWDTTLVVRARAPLCDQTVSSALCGAGRIRSIRHLIKGRNFKATAFVQFDGPEAVERALKMADEITICGKKIEVSKYRDRSDRNTDIKNTVTGGGDDSSDD